MYEEMKIFKNFFINSFYVSSKKRMLTVFLFSCRTKLYQMKFIKIQLEKFKYLLCNGKYITNEVIDLISKYSLHV